MSIKNFRSIGSAQVKMRMVEVEIDGTAGTPVANGFDAYQIKEVIDNGVGSYTIVLLRPFNLDNADKAKAFVQMITPARVSVLSASAHDRVTIDVTDLAGAPADADFSVMIIGSDAKHRQ